MAVPCAQNAATLTLQATICATNVFGSDATEELVGDSNASSHEASDSLDSPLLISLAGLSRNQTDRFQQQLPALRQDLRLLVP